ncbi:4-fold beta flower protein [Wenxinia marina]|uniref:4-fold beta flower domain-containing protein n=1 Tax=Wenxinia marina DSM 24838 TaxID=1123501 RepID=A0A0D0Q3I6_9RHOB|nr:hypothetical protein [Wenxinia marina]KIQ69094.1 hypothetical protein Wenmar_02162 [Wenxinia marina DSM 24838]
MQRTTTLYDSRGEYVAFLHNETLFDTKGGTLGMVVGRFGIIVDMRGGYLGEVGPGNRLVRRCGRNAARVGRLVRGPVEDAAYEDVPAEVIRAAALPVAA